MDTSKESKVFIFHKEKYIPDSLAKALGYAQNDYFSSSTPDGIITHLKENQASLFLINGDSPEDLKTILNEVFGGIKANSTPVLIFSVSNQGSLIHANKSGFKELQECFNNKLVDIIQLPFIQISKIKFKIETLNNAYQNNHKISEEIRKKVAERIAEQQDVSQRHVNKNLQAAERILNGALRSGDYDLLDPNIERRAFDCYKQLISAQPLDYDKETKEALKTIERAKIALESSPAKEEWHKDINRILIIDDQSKMWKPVWEFILGDEKFDIVEDGTKGLEKIIGGYEYDCILLDIDLGNDVESGLHILYKIRQTSPFVPVIMMTAYDDAEVAQIALEMQADAYFAKELREAKNRESVEYYQNFRELVKLISLTSVQLIRVYSIFKKKLPAIKRKDKNTKKDVNKKKYITRIEDGVTGELTKLFLILRISYYHHTVSTLLLNTPFKKPEYSYDEFLIILIDAVLAMMNWDRKEGYKGALTKLAGWQILCTFLVNKNGDILKSKWSECKEARMSAADLYGYKDYEIAGKSLNILWVNQSGSPSIANLKQFDCISKHKCSDGSEIEVSVDIVVKKTGKSPFYKVTIKVPDSKRTPLDKFVSRMKEYAVLRHGKIHNVSKDDILSNLEEFLKYLPDSDEEKYEQKIYEIPEFIMKNISKILRKANKRKDSYQSNNHSLQSNMGAEAILLGAYLQSENETQGAAWGEINNEFIAFGKAYKAKEVIPILEGTCEKNNLSIELCNNEGAEFLKVLLIDDHGIENGWVYVTRVFLNNAIVKYFKFEGSPDDDFNKYVNQITKKFLLDTDLVLLDLRMPEKRGTLPDINVGLRVAKMLRSCDSITPIILLSAYHDSLLIKRAIKTGATDYFPKECPITDTKEELINYAKHFRDIIFQTVFLDKYEIKDFNLMLKRSFADLENIYNNEFNGQNNLLIAENTNALKNLAIELGLQQDVNQVEIRRLIIGNIIWQLRRTVFFWQIPIERYTRGWLRYFCNNLNELRDSFLGYDQVWLNCARIVEFLFNVIILVKGKSEKCLMPGYIKTNNELKTCINTFCNYELGYEIWLKRNERRYSENRDPSIEQHESMEIIKCVLTFLDSAGLITNTKPPSEARQALSELQTNLLKSKKLIEISEINNEIKRLDRTPAMNSAESVHLENRKKRLVGTRNLLQGEINSCRLENILEERFDIIEKSSVLH